MAAAFLQADMKIRKLEFRDVKVLTLARPVAQDGVDCAVTGSAGSLAGGFAASLWSFVQESLLLKFDLIILSPNQFKYCQNLAARSEM